MDRLSAPVLAAFATEPKLGHLPYDTFVNRGNGLLFRRGSEVALVEELIQWARHDNHRDERSITSDLGRQFAAAMVTQLTRSNNDPEDPDLVRCSADARFSIDTLITCVRGEDSDPELVRSESMFRDVLDTALTAGRTDQTDPDLVRYAG